MTIADAFEDVLPRAPAPEKPSSREAEPAPVETTAAPASETRLKVTLAERATDFGHAVAADFQGAWVWDAHGPSVRELVSSRLPAVERVPAESRALWAAWIAWNHLALAVIIPALFACWVLCHPARVLYLLPIAVPMAALWLA